MEAILRLSGLLYVGRCIMSWFFPKPRLTRNHELMIDQIYHDIMKAPEPAPDVVVVDRELWNRVITGWAEAKIKRMDVIAPSVAPEPVDPTWSFDFTGDPPKMHVTKSYNAPGISTDQHTRYLTCPVCGATSNKAGRLFVKKHDLANHKRRECPGESA